MRALFTPPSKYGLLGYGAPSVVTRRIFPFSDSGDCGPDPIAASPMVTNSAAGFAPGWNRRRQPSWKPSWPMPVRIGVGALSAVPAGRLGFSVTRTTRLSSGLMFDMQT
jgi:hypothetical protein